MKKIVLLIASYGFFIFRPGPSCFTYFFQEEFDKPGIEASLNLSAINIQRPYHFLTDDLSVYGLPG